MIKKQGGLSDDGKGIWFFLKQGEKQSIKTPGKAKLLNKKCVPNRKQTKT